MAPETGAMRRASKSSPQVLGANKVVSVKYASSEN